MTRAQESYADEALAGKLIPRTGPYRGVIQDIFPRSHVLLPQIHQIYELDFAYGEYKTLRDEELIQRGAYFWTINGTPTHHFRICMNTPDQVNPSARQSRKNFFAANIFAVGYATHGLFPYRGKFHPQMIKAVMNIMGLKPGDTVIDPMAGCGTTAIEANIMGLNAIAIELSPFACLMTRAKVGVLDIDRSNFSMLLEYAPQIYERFAAHAEKLPRQTSMFASSEAVASPFDLASAFPKLPQLMRELLLLCYLDSVGYASRRKAKTPRDLFPALLQRYLAAVEAFNETREAIGLTLGTTKVMQDDARKLTLGDASMDGILFSPPYSFAIDYVENDRLQLEFLGVDIAELKGAMVGLRGEGRTQAEIVESRVSRYFDDMEAIMRECQRVLRPGRYCTIVVGSNTNQTGGVSLEDGVIAIGNRIGLPLEFQIVREIEGIRNTMRDEFLLFFRKPDQPKK